MGALFSRSEVLAGAEIRFGADLFHNVIGSSSAALIVRAL
jgi:hypothetical protein